MLAFGCYPCWRGYFIGFTGAADIAPRSEFGIKARSFGPVVIDVAYAQDLANTDYVIPEAFICDSRELIIVPGVDTCRR